MNITAKQIATKKKVGSLDGKPVFALATKGGFHIVATLKNGQVETLGTGSHAALAEYIAREGAPDLIWTELSKSDALDRALLELLAPPYRDLTALMQAAEKKRQG